MKPLSPEALQEIQNLSPEALEGLIQLITIVMGGAPTTQAAQPQTTAPPETRAGDPDFAAAIGANPEPPKMTKAEGINKRQEDIYSIIQKKAREQYPALPEAQAVSEFLDSADGSKFYAMYKNIR